MYRLAHCHQYRAHLCTFENEQRRTSDRMSARGSHGSRLARSWWPLSLLRVLHLLFENVPTQLEQLATGQNMTTQ